MRYNSSMKNYGWNAPRLADAYTLEELTALRLEVEAEPKNRNPVDANGRPIKTIWIYTKPAQKKLDAIAWAITFKIKAAASSRLTPAGDSAHKLRRTRRA